jgi:triosephosphate isomerase
MRTPIIAGNWKMNKGATEAEELIRALIPLVKDASAQVVVCPPFTALDRARKALAGSNIALGSQNVFWESEGAFTGEISTSMLTDLGVTYAIVGHSERRQFFHEDDSMVNRRALAALAAGIVPIVCVGELRDERESEKTLEVVTKQIEGAFADLTQAQAATCVVAYEPVWAIGTGLVATPDQAQEVHASIRRLLAKKYGEATADVIRIQYGGSMKPDNAAHLLGRPDIDGGLIGGASLNADSFSAIVGAV